MVEGDGCHRVAASHRRVLVGRRLKASSPNGRFRAGAAAINKASGVLSRIEVHGKNLFYFFGKENGKGRKVVVVHIHFGMAGAFAVYTKEEPEVTASTRLRLEAVGGSPCVAHLSAMTVEFGSVEKMYDRIIAKLGVDPLREDADPERFFTFCAGNKRSIGTVLMDQSCSAGVGNIYRTEALYEAKIHPEQPANTLTRTELVRLWATISKQMQAGFKTGSIWGKKKKSFCYGRDVSHCGGKVTEWQIGGRNVFACGKRQKLDKARRPVGTANVSGSMPKSGTKHLGNIVSASVAEGRKRKAGESMAVQHVALKDDATLAGARRHAASKRRKTLR
eukprot:TRINITY_DN57784_c0_g1_i1.p1 TRINITY_DN57784_c0_g1~~TRINITY_DN57784_c0_g1_i1.p1  ORF type:complete len:350 (-),score=58.06 TRINITY_DN57784_c0_g1_i1:144-1145(-)